jgi:hypothetical protein
MFLLLVSSIKCNCIFIDRKTIEERKTLSVNRALRDPLRLKPSFFRRRNSSRYLLEHGDGISSHSQFITPFLELIHRAIANEGRRSVMAGAKSSRGTSESFKQS